MIDLTRSEKYTWLASLDMGPYVMKKLKVCPDCGQIVAARRIICPTCRRWLSGKTLFDVYKKMHAGCPHCGITLTRDAKFCPHCGREVPRIFKETNLNNTREIVRK